MLLAFGINHKTAPVDIREKVSFNPDRLPEALRELTSAGVEEAAILSTCNRTEIYCGVNEAQTDAVSEWFSDYHRLRREEIMPYAYLHPDRSAVRHVLRVASGLDSLVLGEPQILGQIKQAYQTARHSGTTGKLLGRLFQHTFSVAKQVRTDTEIGSSPVSVAFAAVSLARQIFGDLASSTALLVGAGETIELVARHLHENGVGRIVVANRTLERAHNLAVEVNGYAIALPELPAHLAEADIVISSTASPLPILGKGAVERALKQRRHKPIFMVDIAVPRDIEPEVAELDDVYLYTVDDLHEVIQENLRSRQEAARQAEEIIDSQATHFMSWMRSLMAVDHIRDYREQAELLREEVNREALRQLAGGRDPAEVLAEATRLLANKLTHTPCVQMRQAGYDGQSELLDAARAILLKNDIR